MEVIKVAQRKVYLFNCPNCGSRLQAETKDLVDIGGKVITFYCPICKKIRYISWSSIRKKFIYVDSQN